jgi:hypothetical protein
MVDARRDEAWDLVSHIAWAVVNVNRSPRARTISRNELNPLRMSRGRRTEERLKDPFALAALCGVTPET